MNRSLLSTEGQLVASPRRRAALGLAGAVAAGALALGLTFGGAAVSNAYADEADSSDTVAMADESTSLAEEVAAKVLPSVGSVYALINTGYQQGISQGSCVVLSADGYLLTNYHVIEGATEVQITLNGEAYEAEVVGSDPTSDVAVLKIDPGDDELTPIEIGDSSTVSVGEWVMTVGTPYGESGTVSQGIVSGLNRTAVIELDSTEAYYVGLIQTDAMINSGSSGGALVNAEGQLIGVTTINTTTTGDWAGMSYAIPSNYVIDIATQIIETGTVQHPQIGVSVTSLMEAYYSGVYHLGDSSSVLGAYVAGVVEGSGAEAAGIQVGDVITAIDGNEVYSSDDVIIQVRSHAIGDTVTLTVVRDGEELDIDVVLGSDNAEAAAASAASEEDTSAEEGASSEEDASTEEEPGATEDDSSAEEAAPEEGTAPEGEQGMPDETVPGQSGQPGWSWDDGSQGSGSNDAYGPGWDEGGSDWGYGSDWGWGWGGWTAGSTEQLGDVA